MAGNLYVHVHTAKHPDGELRGAVVASKRLVTKPKGSY
jgi:hypothetical protein